MSESFWILIYAFSDHMLTLVTPAATPPTSGASQGQCLRLLVLNEPAARVERLILLHISSNHRIRDRGRRVAILTHETRCCFACSSSNRRAIRTIA